MIAIAASNGALIKVLGLGDESFGFHRAFGFISERASEQRRRARKAQGLAERSEWLCRFKLDPQGAPTAVEGCQIEKNGDGAWTLATAFGEFVLSPSNERIAPRVGALGQKADRGQRVLATATAILALLVLVLFFAMPKHAVDEVAPQVLEPVAVRVIQETQKAVTVPAPSMNVPKELTQKIQDQKARRSISQNLGFLGMLGRKDLKKALGGVPTSLQDASPGAGPGGTQGSGGELLSGLGQGVKRATVGNTGVAGLGGIGTKGAGGGAGGYGNSMVGSGEGRGLSSMPLSKDIVMEGGLDASVVNATIAKYLSQVRACYENSLRKVPGLTGQVTTSFEIGGAGDVVSSRVSRSTLGNPEAEQCIVQRMMTWKFPKPLGGVNVKVNYPFMLRPVST